MGRRKLLLSLPCVATLDSCSFISPTLPAWNSSLPISLEAWQVLGSALRFCLECHLSVSPPWLLMESEAPRGFQGSPGGLCLVRAVWSGEEMALPCPPSNQSPRLGLLPALPFGPRSLGMSLALALHICCCQEELLGVPSFRDVLGSGHL